MVYITDAIGNEYKEWGAGNLIFISAPTGSGKTTFILKEYLSYWNPLWGKILYLVNRKILKEQLQKEVDKLDLSLAAKIEIWTYQEIEYNENYLVVDSEKHSYVTKEQEEWYRRWFQHYGCVVCDECHYFLMDSNYNTNTIFSYNFVHRMFQAGKRIIFMSATIDEIQKQIEKDFRISPLAHSKWFKFFQEEKSEEDIKQLGGRKYYAAEADYKYLDIHVIRKMDEITELVADSKRKWLIFVDSIKNGEKLKNDISSVIQKSKKDTKQGKNSDKEDVVFITAGYMNEPESAKEVDDIIRFNKQSARVLIATSVLDNGINIKDIELRNLVIIADTKTEFIQMLGRKRKEGQNEERKVQVYIYGQSKNDFIRRRNMSSAKFSIARTKYKFIMEEWFAYVNLQQGRMSKLLSSKDFAEDQLIILAHQFLLKELMKGSVKIEDIKATFVDYAGVLRLNPLSYQNLQNLNWFYDRIIQRFEDEGEDAFLREQMEWLNIPEKEIKRILNDFKETRIEASKVRIREAFEQKVGIPMTKSQNCDFKAGIKPDLILIYKEIGNETRLHSASQDALVISNEEMSFLRNVFGLPYEMKVMRKGSKMEDGSKLKESIYTICRIEEKE